MKILYNYAKGEKGDILLIWKSKKLYIEYLEKKCAKLNAELRRYKKLYSSMCSAERRKIIDHKWYQKRKMEEKDEI